MKKDEIKSLVFESFAFLKTNKEFIKRINIKHTTWIGMSIIYRHKVIDLGVEFSADDIRDESISVNLVRLSQGNLPTFTSSLGKVYFYGSSANQAGERIRWPLELILRDRLKKQNPLIDAVFELNKYHNGHYGLVYVEQYLIATCKLLEAYIDEILLQPLDVLFAKD